jgi:hypothetical protein
MICKQAFSQELKAKIYDWLKTNASEKKMGDRGALTRRKKALGLKEIMGLSSQIRDAIALEIEAKFDFLFKQLNAVNNKELVDKYVTLKRVIVRKREHAAAVVHDGEGAD